MPDFLDDILKKFRPEGDDESSEEADAPLDTEEFGSLAAEALEESEDDAGPSTESDRPRHREGGSRTESFRVPVRAGWRRPSDAMGETPTENIQLSLEELVGEINQLKGDIRGRDHELKKREQYISELRERYDELSQERERYQEKTNHLELQLNSYMTRLEDAEEKTEKISARLKATQAEKSKSERLLSEARDNLHALSTNSVRGDKKASEIEEEKEKFQRKSNQMELQLNALISQMEENQQEVSTAREEVEWLRNERDRLLARLGKASKARSYAPPAAGEAPQRPESEVDALEEKLTAILGGDPSPAEGQASPEGSPENFPDIPVGDIAPLIPEALEGELLTTSPAEETGRMRKSDLKDALAAEQDPFGNPTVEKRLLKDNRLTLRSVLSGGGVSPLGLGAFIADLDKALKDGSVTPFTGFNGRQAEGYQKLYFTTKLAMALAGERGYEHVEVRKVGICALLVLGNGGTTPANIQQEYNKIIAVAGAYGRLIAKRPPILPGEAVAELITYVEAGELDKDCVKSFLRMASLFPPGSWIQLSTGEVGRVVAVNPSDARRPVVEIRFQRSGRSMTIPRKIDLLKTTQLQVGRAVAAPASTRKLRR
ncbi:MAG: hypothetical protein O7H41_10530 [Planctomycetota bacterium]|nr:hypothetical protein [Planctomycetota bacterium]